MSALSSISVVLPVYNEEHCVLNVLKGVFSYLQEKNIPHELIVVNDGSTDSTKQILQSAQETYSNLSVVTHETNRGYGEALRSGFNAAKNDWILLMDSDGQFAIEALEAFLPYTSTHDLIVGVREKRADPWLRRLSGALYALMVRILFRLPLQDPTCGFKLFSRRSWQQSNPIASQDHKIFTIEWLLRAQQTGARFAQVPVQHFPRIAGKSTGARSDVVFQTFVAAKKLLSLYKDIT